jgi:hypothetical protein
MTTVYLSDKKCFICGEESKFPMGNLSLGNVSARDLDGRPTSILRSSVYLWIQRCPGCGYCAPEIAEGDEIDRELVASNAYDNQLNDRTFPETANSFLCHSLVMKNKNFFADAGWAAVFAAWICDDNDFPDSAAVCRAKAIRLFSSAREKGQDFASSPEQEQIYFIDLHRRQAEFGEASKLCDLELEKEHSDNIYDVLYFERELIDKKDSTIHTVAEAMDSDY